MNAKDRAYADLADEATRLRALLRRRDRQLRQLERTAATSETISATSKRAMLHANALMLRTVRELEATAADLSQARDRAEMASAAKGRFLAVMSHELRTPLNGILGSIELLRAAADNEERDDLMELMHRSASALLGVINDVLDLSKIEAGRVTMEYIPFRLAEVLSSVMDLVRHGAVSKGLTLQVNAEQHLPAIVIGDPVRLRQVCLNLVGNAVKFTAAGAVTLEVRRSTGHRIAFCVADTGPGIAPDILPRLFEPFAQADAATARRYGGTGLGLNISQELVALMGGDLKVESQPGKGSTFYFELPLPETATEPPTAATAVNQENLGMHVLVVDDVEANRMVAAKMLCRIGCTVQCAANGTEALEAARAAPFDVILMDCLMPVMDGYQATRLLRQSPETGTTPIVALTANVTTEDTQRCFDAGMDAVLTKPVRLADLAAALRPFAKTRQPLA